MTKEELNNAVKAALEENSLELESLGWMMDEDLSWRDMSGNSRTYWNKGSDILKISWDFAQEKPFQVKIRRRK